MHSTHNLFWIGYFEWIYYLIWFFERSISCTKYTEKQNNKKIMLDLYLYFHNQNQYSIKKWNMFCFYYVIWAIKWKSFHKYCVMSSFLDFELKILKFVDKLKIFVKILFLLNINIRLEGPFTTQPTKILQKYIHQILFIIYVRKIFSETNDNCIMKRKA